MRRENGVSLAGLLVIGGVVGLLALASVAAAAISGLLSAKRRAQQTICMGNLSCIGKAVSLYKNEYDDRWPWIDNPKGWDVSTRAFFDVPTGDKDLRREDPYKDPNAIMKPRSITSLVFLLVREQSPAFFVCPSDREASVDTDIKWDHDRDKETDDVYHWDFSSHRNVSYSWQSPMVRRGKLVQGISDAEPGAVVAADKTPLYDDPNWAPDAIAADTAEPVLRRSISANHRADGAVPSLTVAMYVVKKDRPDVGMNNDNIYTASGDAKGGSQGATSLKLTDHLSPRDSFLVGPVRARPQPAATQPATSKAQ